MNWRLECAIVLVFTLAFVGLGVMVATPVESAPRPLLHFSQGKPRRKVYRRVLGHPRRGKRAILACAAPEAGR